MIIELEAKKGDTTFVAIERSLQGEPALWAKRKFRTDAEMFAAHVAAWLIKLHGDSVFSKLDLDMQKVVKEIVRREGVPMCPEEAEIEDTSKIEIDSLKVKELEIIDEEDKSVAIDNTSIVHFGDQS